MVGGENSAVVDKGLRRLPWAQLPADVRAVVEEILGAPVVTAVSQPGGFSAGSADRVRTSTGAKAFVKAISARMNAGAADLHRREARVTAVLPAAASAPELLGVHDDGEWVALVLQDLDGWHPVLPWQAGELRAVLTTLQAIARCPAPAGIPAAGNDFLDQLAGWHRIAADPPQHLTAWATARLPQLCALADAALADLGGDALVHSDLRADNLLIRPDGTVAVVDWPWACRGPAWLDTLMLLTEVHQYGGHDVHSFLAQGLPAHAAPQQVTNFLAGYAGYFLDAARHPAPPGMDSLRAHQRAKGTALLSWARSRLAA